MTMPGTSRHEAVCPDVAESRAELAAGRFVVESPERHVARVQALSANAALELVWVSRERFLPAATGAGENPADAAVVANLVGGYLHVDAPGSMAQPSPPYEPATVAAADRREGAQLTPNVTTGQEGDADVLRVDTRVHVMSSGCFVTAQGADLVVRKRKAEIFRTPLAELTMLYLEGKAITISSDLTMQRCELGGQGSQSSLGTEVLCPLSQAGLSPALSSSPAACCGARWR